MAISAVITAATAAASIYNGQQQARAQRRAANASIQQQQQAQRDAERQFNAANQKAPNLAAIMKRNRAGEGGGVGGTYLTGAGGAPVSAGMLGRTTVLGS